MAKNGIFREEAGRRSQQLMGTVSGGNWGYAQDLWTGGSDMSYRWNISLHTYYWWFICFINKHIFSDCRERGTFCFRQSKHEFLFILFIKVL